MNIIDRINHKLDYYRAGNIRFENIILGNSEFLQAKKICMEMSFSQTNIEESKSFLGLKIIRLNEKKHLSISINI